jgi:CubicO group peptidase (beta-lactamase class C family)
VAIGTKTLEDVERLFFQQITDNVHPGAQLAVYRQGRLVLDLWGGLADTQQCRKVERDTLFVLFSSTKPLASMSLHLLIERGQAQLDAPVATYWPEFAANGKAGVTIRHVLTHKGGFPETPPDLPWSAWGDWDAVVRAMENLTPRWTPGEVSAYHPINHGWVCGELVRRIDGRPFPQFLRQEITGPLGMQDTYVGLPVALEERVARLHALADVDDSGMGFVRTFNRPQVHQAVLPAACGIATARDMARFYAMLAAGGSLDGVRLFAPETVARATAVAIDGEHDHSLDQTVRRGLGFNLGGMPVFSDRMGRTSTVRAFGHGGAGTSICWADPDLELACVFIPNGYRGRESLTERCQVLSDAVRQACR